MVHALEMSDDPESLLREVWRVLAPSGRWLLSFRTGAGSGRGPTIHRSVTAVPIRARRSCNCCGKPGLLRRLGRGAVPAAGRQELVPAFGDGVGTCRRSTVVAVRRRACRGSDQAGLSRVPVHRERTRLISSLQPVLVPSSTARRKHNLATGRPRERGEP